jgi:hypothetical protein
LDPNEPCKPQGQSGIGEILPDRNGPRRPAPAAAATRHRAYQRDLQDRREHRSVDAARLATIGRAVGQQVRVLLSGDAFGLYTASEVHPENPDTTVRGS